jgi:hypothetical protein
LSSPTTHLSEQEISDWFDNPITQHFFKAIENAVVVIYDDKANAKRDTPLETQLRHEFLDGAEWAFQDMLLYAEAKRLPEVNDE